MSVQRHTKNCLPARIAIAQVERVETNETLDFIDMMTELYREGLEQLAEARKSGTHSDRSKVLKECRENVMALAKLSGAIPSTAASTTNIDARTLNVNIKALENLSVEELRRLSSVVPNA